MLLVVLNVADFFSSAELDRFNMEVGRHSIAVLLLSVASVVLMRQLQTWYVFCTCIMDSISNLMNGFQLA